MIISGGRTRGSSSLLGDDMANEEGTAHETAGEARVPRDLDEAAARIAQLEAELQEALFDNGVLRLQLDMLASTDIVTGLPNANGILEVVEKAAARHARSGETFALMFVGIPALQRVAERFGREGLEDALRHASALVGACVRRLDTVGRVDEEGLVAVMPMLEERGIPAVVTRMEHLLQTVPMVFDEESIHLVPSFAVVMSNPQAGVDPSAMMSELIAARDRAVPGVAVVVRAGVSQDASISNHEESTNTNQGSSS